MSFEQLTLYAATHPDEKIFVYSYDISKNQYVPALATNIGIRQYVNKIARVTLDDGGVIHCTTDHLFLTQDRGYVEAKDLYSGESLVPLYTRTNKDGREEIYNNNHWEPTFHWSKRCTSFINWKQGYNMVIHHKDIDKGNDNPDNLQYMTNHDHSSYHGNLSFSAYNKSEAHKQRISDLHKQGIYDPAANIIANMNYSSLTEYNKSYEHKEKIREAHKQGKYDYTAMRKGATIYLNSEAHKQHMNEMNNDPQIKLNQLRGRLAKYGKMYILDGFELTEDLLTNKESREKIMNIYRRHFNIIVVVDMVLFAVISGLSTEMIVVRFLGFSVLNAVTSTLWGAVIQDRINNVLHGSELTDWSALLSAYKLYAALIGSALLFIIVSMPIEVAIGLQCFGNTAMGLLDIKAYKLLKEDQNNQQKE